MGTSLSGLTPATTFDGLLKVGDNDPLTADLKAISTGDGTDTILSLSTGALSIGGQTTIIGSSNDFNTTALLLKNSDSNELLKITNRGDYILGYAGMSGAGTLYASANGLLFNIGNANRSEFRSTYQWWNVNGGFGITAAPTARLHVKGEAPSGDPLNNPTALLVQNSTGAELLSVKDDKSVSISGSLRISNKAVLGWDGALFAVRYLYQSGVGNHIFYTNSGQERMRITNDGTIGIGESTPTARLHVKGEAPSGDPLNNPTALLVENSDGTEMLKVTDDGVVDVRSALNVNHPTVSTRQLKLGWGSIFATDNTSELTIGAVYSQTTAPRIYLGGKTRSSGADAIQVQALNGMYIATTANAEDPSAQLHVKGSAPVEDPPGTFSNPTVLLLQNSDGNDLLKVTNDGVLQINSDATERFTIAGANGTAQLNFRYNNIYTSGGNVLYLGGSKTILQGSGSARVIAESTGTTIKGSGNNANTTALLVENSDGADLLKIADDGDTVIKSNGGFSFETIASTKRIEVKANGEVLLKGGQLAAYSNYNSSNSNLIVGDFTTPTARLHVKGEAPSGDPLNNPTVLLVENNAGTDLLKIDDAGNIVTPGFTILSNTIRPNVNGYIGIDRSNNRTFSIVDSNATRTYLNVESSSTSNFADVSINTDHLVVKKDGNVAVGTSTIDASAKLQVDSTTQGFLPPRMTEAQRLAINMVGDPAVSTPAIGLMVYQTDGDEAGEGPWVYTSFGWKKIQLM